MVLPNVVIPLNFYIPMNKNIFKKCVKERSYKFTYTYAVMMMFTILKFEEWTWDKYYNGHIAINYKSYNIIYHCVLFFKLKFEAQYYILSFIFLYIMDLFYGLDLQLMTECNNKLSILLLKYDDLIIYLQ